MSNLYDLDGIKKDLENSIENITGLIQAWESVTFQTKKDGKPFKNLSQNFKNATYRISTYANDNTQKRLYVYTYINGKHDHDSIDCYDSDFIRLSESQKAKTENFVKDKYGMEVYMYDLNDIKEAIKNRITYLKDDLKSYEYQLKNADIAFKTFLGNYESAVKQLAKDSDINENDKFHSTLFHNVIDTVMHKVIY